MNASALPAPERLSALLASLYGPEVGAATARAMVELIARNPLVMTHALSDELSERDALLITYADQVRAPGQAPLETLADFCRQHLAGLVSGVHLLPFYPWTSDDGFSVKDFFAVNPEYGTWQDVAKFQPEFALMFDAVFNHMSSQSDWFLRFVQDEPDFRDFFVTVLGSPDLSQVVRPRALPLLTEFQTARGPENVWTTFSADQVDVNVRNPRVLLALTEALLFYVQHGARFIRLDAIAYLWKEIGTNCIHLPQTHAVIQVWRAVLDMAVPQVQLITETNVPHRDNISYFGDGTNEAQLVYNFALPPLVLHALLRGDSSFLTQWAATLATPAPQATFFNFLASHDGIGLNPARGILPQPEIDFLVERCLAHGGFISYKHNADGSKSPYEMNVVYFDAVNDPAVDEPATMQVDRFLVAQAIMLAIAGVPGIYFHSLFGSRNDRPGALQSGINRRINREKCLRKELEGELATPTSLRAAVFGRFSALLRARREHAAFRPRAAQKIYSFNPRIFALLRAAQNGQDWVLCLHNVSREVVTVRVAVGEVTARIGGTELLSGITHAMGEDGTFTVTLQPYEVNWLAGWGNAPLALT